MKTEGKKRKSGSAIIIAFLLMAVVSGTAFAIARLFYLDTAAGGLYENSTVAYYAAESGIEEGMLRYRFNRNAQVESGTTDYVNYAKVNRNNLTTGAVTENTSPGNNVIQSDQVYDLNMFYKAPYYGTDANNDTTLNQDDLALVGSGYGEEYKVPRDEAVKIDITDTLGTGLGDSNLFVKLGAVQTSSGMRTDDQAFIEARITGTVGNDLKEFKRALYPQDHATVERTGEAYAPMLPFTGADRIYEVFSLKTTIAGSNLFNTTSGNRVFLYLKPIGYDIYIGLVSQGNSPISAPYSTIKSTGYYGGVGRTLTAKIDRQSGTVYDIFDFVVYQHP